MAQGLRPHYHQDFVYRTEQHYNKKKHCLVKKEQRICMICGRVRYTTDKCYVPPPKQKQNKSNHSNH